MLGYEIANLSEKSIKYFEFFNWILLHGLEIFGYHVTPFGLLQILASFFGVASILFARRMF